MPVYTHKADGSLLVTFVRDGEADEMQLARSPERALIIAMSMLARRSAFYAGDYLSVKDADDGVDLTTREAA
jgi:hypothetical protein